MGLIIFIYLPDFCKAQVRQDEIIDVKWLILVLFSGWWGRWVNLSVWESQERISKVAFELGLEKEDWETETIFLSGKEYSEKGYLRIEISWGSWELLFIMISKRQVSVASFQSPVISQKTSLNCVQSSRVLQRPLAANCSSVSCNGLCRWGRGCLGTSWLLWCCFHRVWQSPLKDSTSCLSRLIGW